MYGGILPMEEDRISENYRITEEELKVFFNGRRKITIDEYYAFLKWREETKKRAV